MADRNIMYGDTMMPLIQYIKANKQLECMQIALVEREWQMIVDTLEKQIPKRPYIKRNTKKLEWVCGNCKVETVEYKDFYCSHCGWKIDWRDGDE